MSRSMSKDGKMESLTGPQLLFAGGAAGMLSWLFNYPSDVVKTRFQANDNYKSYLHCIQSTYREGGMRMFYTGLGSTLLRLELNPLVFRENPYFTNINCHYTCIAIHSLNSHLLQSFPF
ncbi:unnamed protein product [Strongylus vulgaris]|uniref:Mitochondrial carrier protein n=1 Tax=Strongylus vulgaris TaxID=40348 RepID=A0A3P7JJJ0_STRVU|nr:unnamed protein product [Strongylus vulgaris]